MKMIKVGIPAVMCVVALSMAAGVIAWTQATADDLGTPEEACVEVDAASLDACLDAEFAKQERTIIATRAYQIWLADRLAEDGGARNLALALHLRHRALAAPEVLNQADVVNQADHAADEIDGLLSNWMDKASAGAGHDGVVWALLASTAELPLMPKPHGVDLTHAWAEAEPDNLTPLLMRMRSQDDAAMIFAALDVRSRHAIYWDEVQALGLHAVERHPPKAQWRDEMPAFFKAGHEHFGTELASALALPLYQHLMAACKPPLIDTKFDRRAQCSRLGTMLQDRADTLIGRFIGNALLRFSADSDAARATAEVARNRLRWRQSRVQAHQGAAYDAAYQAALREGGPFDETMLIDRALKAVGVELSEPPDDWVPDVVSPK